MPTSPAYHPVAFLPPLEPSRQGMLFTAMLNDLKREKPWAKLRMPRREYETKRPWANSGLSRKRWEEGLGYLPDEAIDMIYREAEADLLVEAIFGKTE